MTRAELIAKIIRWMREFPAVYAEAARSFKRTYGEAPTTCMDDDGLLALDSICDAVYGTI